MDYRIMIQGTPNPNALKFVLNVPVKNSGNATFKRGDDYSMNAIAKHLFDIKDINEVYFFDNYITVTQNGSADWDVLEEKVKITIMDHIATHNPDFEVVSAVKQKTPVITDPELLKIDEIINKSVRPYLQMDGGDLELVSLDGNVLRVNYQGACGSCPSSAMGTLKSIETLLRDEYNPEISVELAPLF